MNDHVALCLLDGAKNETNAGLKSCAQVMYLTEHFHS